VIPWLSLLVGLPFLGGIALMAMPDRSAKIPKMAAMAISGLTLLLSIVVLAQVKAETFHFQLLESADWIKPLGIKYILGIDGISYWMVLLTTLLSFVAVTFGHSINDRTKMFMGFLLLLESAMLGAFLSLDLILFFTFFELTLLPMFFLVNIWGGAGRKKAAAKFLIYTFAGSIFMLVGMVALAVQHREATGFLSFSILDIQASVASGQFWTNALQAQTWGFWAFAIALLIKTPAFPFHSWIPDTYSESPIVAPILSSVMVKLGTYGFLRFVLPLYPEATQQFAPVILALATIGILYGAVVATVQTDARKVIAYSSLSHMGFILLGIFSLTHAGMVGSGIQMFAHGISTALMLMTLGFLLLRKNTTDFAAFGGLKAKVPVMSFIFLVGMLGSVGLPGTNGFVGEFMALYGAFEAGIAQAFGINVGFAILSGIGVIIGAVYLLGMYRKLFLGPISAENETMADLHPRELGMAAIMAVLVLVGGLLPTLFFKPMEASTQATRLMATNPVGQRPVWTDATHEISMKPEEAGSLLKNGQVIAPGRLHLLPSRPLGSVATTTGGEE
jgi:NADH-quinone oxidoreductase subunit M